MPVSLENVGRHARMDLVFAQQGSRTILRHAYCEVPFKVTRVLNWQQPAAHLILMHSTAGVFGGDELECSIRAERGTRALVTQQSATKIHPSEGRPAIQTNHIVVETGAELELFLEPLIPFADSILRQSTRIEVAPGGRLVFWEGMMAGRVGRGECWAFRELAMETHLLSGNQSVYLDRFRLPTGFERSAWAMADRNYVGTGLYVGEEAQGFAETLHAVLPDAGIDTPRAEVVVTRVVSASGPDFYYHREMFCRQAGNKLSSTSLVR